jgi:hypothetical protein
MTRLVVNTQFLGLLMCKMGIRGTLLPGTGKCDECVLQRTALLFTEPKHSVNIDRSKRPDPEGLSQCCFEFSKSICKTGEVRRRSKDHVHVLTMMQSRRYYHGKLGRGWQGLSLLFPATVHKSTMTSK